MTTMLYDLTVGSYTQVLEGAVSFMEKGLAHCQTNGIDLVDVVNCTLYEAVSYTHLTLPTILLV